jgi:hypothetical protein
VFAVCHEPPPFVEVNMNSDVSTSLLPFVDEINCPLQFGSEFDHVSPELVDTYVSLPLATSFVPSAELAMDVQPVNGAPVCVQICALAEWMKRDRLPAATVMKGKVFMLMCSVSNVDTASRQKYSTPRPLAMENLFAFRILKLLPEGQHS